MHRRTNSGRPVGALLALVLLAPAATAQGRSVAAQRNAKPAGFVITAPAPPAAKTGPSSAYDRDRLLAGHLLRRVGFGPSPADMEAVIRMGRAAYIEQQLDPASVDDSATEARLPRVELLDPDDAYVRRWFVRMVYSRRQLQEKMTLIWHEHFATSNSKIGDGLMMDDQEQMLRGHALGSFRQLLADVTRDNAMLWWLDNANNFGKVGAENYLVPNENYARELLQLFSLGTVRLKMDGTPVLGPDGLPIPAYTESDVREVARALSGWSADGRLMDEARELRPAQFVPDWHDERDKTIFGQRLTGLDGEAGAEEVDRVVDLIMDHPNTAPFIAKLLLQKLATETPSPGYVARAADTFRQTDGDIRATVRTILLDPEFESDAVVRTQFKSPIEFLVGMVRAIGFAPRGDSLASWSFYTGHFPHNPPSVFSFYRPGNKGALVTESQAGFYDTFADAFVDGYTDGYTDADFDAEQFMRDRRLKPKKPAKAVDALADALLVAPLEPATYAVVLEYLGRRVTPERLRGAAWLIITSPEYQLN